MSRGKKRTFEVAAKEIETKYPELELLIFTKTDGYAIFLDKDYGQFEAKCFRTVLRGLKTHPLRAKENRINKQKKTNLERFGVEYPLQSKELKHKLKNTCLQKYGVEHHLLSKDVRNKIYDSNLTKFGSKSPFSDSNVKEKIKQTNLEKYGVENVSQREEIKRKKESTSIDNYSVAYPIQSQIVKDKLKKTNLQKYGAENPQQNEEVRYKTESTNLQKYGCKSPLQNKLIFNKVKDTLRNKYGYNYLQQIPDFKEKARKSNMDSGYWHNIDGYSLAEYYRNTELLNIRSYSHIQHCYNKDGNEALELEYYNELSGKSRIANKWLYQVESELGYSLVREYHIPNTLYHADGYDQNTNTIYEFYGDYWHGYPFKYLGVNKYKDTSFNTLFYKTLERESEICSLGYNIIYIWENDFPLYYHCNGVSIWYS